MYFLPLWPSSTQQLGPAHPNLTLGIQELQEQDMALLGTEAQGQAFLLAHPQPAAMLLHSTIFTSYYW